MSDWVERQAAIDLIETITVHDGVMIDHDTVLWALMVLPSAQPELKKGEWLTVETSFEGSEICKCSICGHKIWRYMDGSMPFNFCPNCGSDMRGEQDGSG